MLVVHWIVWSLKCTFQKDMKSSVQLDGLLFSSDTEILCVMNQILDTFAIHTEICSDLESAIDTVTHRRLDTVIVDWNGSQISLASCAQPGSPLPTATRRL